MAIRLNEKFLNGFVKEEELTGIKAQIESAHETLNNKNGLGSDFLGWDELPVSYNKNEFARIKKSAEKIIKDSDVLIVIGIGGSYLGAKSAIDFLKTPFYNNKKKNTPDIYFAGNNISSEYLITLLEICEGKDFSVNVISKSGTTTEPALAFRVFKKLLEDRYGKEEAKNRIYATTDAKKGTLKELTAKEGYESFVITDDIGGRYSVLTAVGLLPIAVTGADIDKMMLGAADAKKALSEKDLSKNDCLKYAAYRNILYRKGKTTEILANYEPSLTSVAEWWKQLFGESEGKDGKGIFPAAVSFSTDLHSLGQYIQDGVRNLFETVLWVKIPKNEFVVEKDELNLDGLNFLSNKTMNEINEKAFYGTILAHNDGGVPNIVLEMDKADEYNYGYMVYFFEKACAVSGYLMGVNPFNQPGVESYKKNMFALLGKSGYENERITLEKRIGL